MKTFKVSEDGSSAGLRVTAEPYPHVGIGEEGRGRTYVRVPVGEKFATSLQKETIGRCQLGWDCDPAQLCPGREEDPALKGSNPLNCQHRIPKWEYDAILDCAVIRTKEKGTVLLVEPQEETDERALVYLQVLSGFRGDVKYVFPEKGVTLLFEGAHAQGIAGRMGGGPEYLAIIEPGAKIQVHRGGRLYGAPANLVIYYNGQEISVGEEDVVCPPTGEEQGEIL